MREKNNTAQWESLYRFNGDFRDYLTHLNVSRLWMAAAVLLLSQLGNLSDAQAQSTPWMRVFSAVAAALSIGFLLYGLYYKRRRPAIRPYMRVLYLAFWVILCVGMVPYLHVDALRDILPTNCLLFCCIIMIVPVLPAGELVPLLVLFFVENMWVCVVAHVQLSYYLFAATACVAAGLFSFHTHHFYIGMMMQLKSLAQTDPLSQLHNRASGFDRAAALLAWCRRAGQPYAVFMIDIDEFRQFNNQYGHATGDATIQYVAGRLRALLRRASDVVFRYGGEEFAAAVAVDQPADAERFANLLREEIARGGVPYGKEGQQLHVTVSIGVYVCFPTAYDEEQLTCRELLDKADAMLYRAKAEGRDCVRVQVDGPPHVQAAGAAAKGGAAR